MTLIPILGDQLSPTISALDGADKGTTRILMAEVREEGCHVPQHKKKIAFFFAAMRHFAEEMRQSGWDVTYVTLDDPANSGSLAGEIARHAKGGPVVMTEPGEHRLRKALAPLATFRPDTRFIAAQSEFDAWAEGRKELRMEYFYRDMRRKTGLLMEPDGTPTGARWNFDAENRKPARADLFMPEPLKTKPDAITSDVLDLVAREFPDNPGSLTPFWFATTRDGAAVAARHFMETALAGFGDYQDAMLEGERFLYHSLLSMYLNTGLLNPLELCRIAEAAYHAGSAPLNAVEGYIRQIIGWREYIRGIYFHEGADYTRRNHLGASRALPAFYWNGETDMACMAAAIGQTLEEAYAHHIQRLMVTGNFALVAGIDPYQVHEWYLAVYADAIEWVEAPNTIGMSQFADGGIVASKPYAASGAYIDRMSDHCKTCRYKVKEREGPDACPFNALYWDFLLRNEATLGRNHRLGRVYANWRRMDEAKQIATRAKAAETLARLDAGERI